MLGVVRRGVHGAPVGAVIGHRRDTLAAAQSDNDVGQFIAVFVGGANDDLEERE